MKFDLIKHDLDFTKTFSYFIDHMHWESTLSNKIVDNIDFEKGKFYTFQPITANLKKIYDFSEGGILPQNIPYKSGDSIWMEIPNIKSEIANFVYNSALENVIDFVFFEDYNASPRNKHLVIDNVDLIIYKEQIYYLIKNPILLKDLKNAIQKTQSLTHSILLLGKGLKTQKFDSEEDFDTVSKSAVIIGTTAYDGEGFIFWEKNN